MNWKEKHAAIKILHESGIEWQELKNQLDNLPLICPECLSEHLQLFSWPSNPAQYKCRSCHHQFKLFVRPKNFIKQPNK